MRAISNVILMDNRSNRRRIFVDDRSVVVSDTTETCIHSFSLDGRFQWKAGRQGANLGELKWP